jgi:hypothetical protein
MDRTFFTMIFDPACKRLLKFLDENAGLELNEDDTKRALLRTMAFTWKQYPPLHIFEAITNDASPSLTDSERIAIYESLLQPPLPWAVLMPAWARPHTKEDFAEGGCTEPEDIGVFDETSYGRVLNIYHDRDRDSGPRESWKRWHVRSSMEQDSQQVASRKLARLRSIGYVFWDKDRTEHNWPLCFQSTLLD